MSWKQIFVRMGFTWSLKDIWYRLDWNTPSVSSIKKYLNRNVDMVYKDKLIIPLFKGTNRDVLVMNCFKWVVDNIRYERDIDKFGVEEKWEDIDNILSTGRADCESMSTLLYVLCRVHGVNPLQIKLVCGEVVVGNGTGGHAWVEYMSDETMEWTILDPAYDPKYTTFFDKRRPAEFDDRYVKRWFEVNDLIIS